MKTIFYEIEPYQIHAAGLELTVMALDDGVYRVYNEENRIADLYPEITAIFGSGA